MDKHWIVVAHKGGARVFEQDSAESMHVIERFDNEQGRVKTSERVSDRQGRAEVSGTTGHAAMGTDDKQKDQILNSFASRVCTFLDNESAKNSYGSLTLVAEAQTLGVFRKSLGKPTEMKLKNSLSKDLVHVADQDMAQQLKMSL